MNEMMTKISNIGIVPVIKIEDVEKAVPLAKALCKGGIPVAEITFRTAQAEEAIKRVVKEVPEMLTGAGTVLSVEQVKKAVAAGAQFIVSPGYNAKVVEYCVQNNIPVVPGCNNPSDIERALELGLEVVKFFPAEASGGLATIKALAAPYGNVKFMPTGGVNAKNIKEYLSFDKIVACGGSWMVKEDLIKAGDFDKITELAKEAVESMLEFKLAHIGINTESDTEAKATAQAFAKLFNLPVKDGNSSVFAGTAVEVMKSKGPGKNGHIAVSTSSVARAVSYLKMQGVEFDMDTAKYDAKGNLSVVYVKGEIGGFAVHLVAAK